jgi:hypothetical protein
MKGLLCLVFVMLIIHGFALVGVHLSKRLKRWAFVSVWSAVYGWYNWLEDRRGKYL